jgi:GNAT superfamily N-acetyltransferase
MPVGNQQFPVSPQLLQCWLTGWTLARETSPPAPDSGGFRVDVGWPHQRVRYVFPAVSAGYRRLARAIVEPWIHLKVCADVNEVREQLPPRWAVQPPGFMMTSDGVRSAPSDLPAGYSFDVNSDRSVPIVRVVTTDGETVSIGRVATVDGFAIFDRIETAAAHRRRGLASAVMGRLTQIAGTRGATRGVLVATAEGKSLYKSLGWQLCSPYTTAVIPGLDE